MPTTVAALRCDQDKRRTLVAGDALLHGIDFVEVVGAEQKKLRITFLEKTVEAQVPVRELVKSLTANAISIEGGSRIRDVRVVSVTPMEEQLEVVVYRAGDFSDYVLTINDPRLDPILKSGRFNFKAGCPNDVDCAPAKTCAPERLREPNIDYLAKDYASFRRALLDWLPTLMPSWQERLEADLGITLLELLAYVADNLSYYQDAVANEAWLETARQRISVRRHARLIDYYMHDGVSARVLIRVEVSANDRIPRGTSFLTRIERPVGSLRPSEIPKLILKENAQAALAAADHVFESLEDVDVKVALNEIGIHTWLNDECCLPRGATEMDLVGLTEKDLAVGALLLLEERVVRDSDQVKSEGDPAHRHLIRIIEVKKLDPDPLGPSTLLHVKWGSDDALPFEFCVHAQKTGYRVEGIVRGNLVLADHGRRIDAEEHDGPLAAEPNQQRRAFRVRLDEGPMSFRVPLPNLDPLPRKEDIPPAADLWTLDPFTAQPQVRLEVGPEAEPWHAAQPDLLKAGPFDASFVVETDNQGRAVLRFGLDEHGRSPPEGDRQGVVMKAMYRIGVGAAGNVPRGAIAHVIAEAFQQRLESASQRDESSPPPGTKLDFITDLTNPLPGRGGVDPEAIAHVKQVAPAAFHAEQLRAVTPEDYVTIAQKHPAVDRAHAEIRWTGSWYTVFVSIDPKDRPDLADADGLRLLEKIRKHVISYAMAGYDVDVEGPQFVALDITLSVQPHPDFFPAQVKAEILDRLSSRRRADGTLGFFHPDNFSFGQPLYLSRLIEAIEGVAGVVAVTLDDQTRFRRQDEANKPNRPDEATQRNLTRGFIAVSDVEILRLDNDPSFPENGVLVVKMTGVK